MKSASEKKGQIITEQTMEEVLHNSMIPYAEYVIMDRAIPRVEDGLKPVQRRILYTMLELGMTPDKPQRKSARIVGDCLGKFHPHGDSSVYNAMVRMAQPWAQRGVLVDGHGNFGSIDGDGAAAMRYTEAKLAPLAMELLRDLDKNTVDFQNNFDDSMLEPSVLPGRYPNLLVNGASGIAVGLATNIPPHNISEVINGVVSYIDNPQIDLEGMMKYIKGPDFPTGGYIIDETLKDAYRTGNGKIKIRAKTHIENGDAGKKNIIISEIPYQVNKSSMLQKINVLKEDKTSIFGGIAEIIDESDSEIRVVIKIKKDYDPKAVLEALYKKSEMEVGFSFNMVAIAGGKPRTLSLLEIIRHYVDFQVEVIVRRTKHDLANAKERAHILQGLMVAVRNIDEVVQIIKKSENTKAARINLMERFSLSERQAQAILDMRLARITSLEIYKLEEELNGLVLLIASLEGILESKARQLEVVKEEILAIKKTHGEARRSVIFGDVSEVETEDQTDDVTMDYILARTVAGTFKRASKAEFAKHEKTLAEEKTREDEFVYCDVLVGETTDVIYAFTKKGKCVKMSPKDVTVSKWKDKGKAISGILKDVAGDDEIVKMQVFDSEKAEGEYLFFTRGGMVKKTLMSDYILQKQSFDALKLKEGDEVVAIEKFEQNKNMIFVTSKGMVLCASMADVPTQGRISAGVKGVNLEDGDFVVFAGTSGKVGEIVVVSDSAMAKRVVISTIEPISRARKGVKIFDLRGGARIIFASLVKMPYDVAIISDTKEISIINTEDFEVERRETKGRAVNVNFFEKLVGGVKGV
ncbi:MAG: DNA topoisomerase (ATP-hydrolyzing) [Bacillota bacterium]